MSPARRRPLRAALPVLAFSVALLASCTEGAPAQPRQDIEVTVARGNCGQTWRAPSVRPATFRVHNVDSVTAEVDLIDPRTGGIFGEIEALAPATIRPLRVRLGRGSYAFRCLAEDSDAVTGPTVRVSTADPAAAVAILPVTKQDLVASVDRYDAYVARGLATLGAHTAALAVRLRAGDVVGAKAAWLTAHLDYERLGAAYGTFGDYADAIDGLPDGLPGGVHDPDFRGFGRLENGLWHGATARSLVSVADRLAADVASLRRELPSLQTDPNDLPRSAHEIMEESAQFQLTGAGDQGSGTGLATVQANLDGTEAVVGALAPVFRPRYAGWTTMIGWLGRARAAVAAQRRPDGSYPPVESLPTADRERLDAAVGQLLETLAPLAAIGEVRRAS